MVSSSKTGGDVANSESILRPIFAIFEGGGAKGVAHVGALKAVQENGLDIIGVAGTSAGALAAVLIAIGLEADDIFDVTGVNSHILEQYNLSPVDVLGKNGWNALCGLRRSGHRNIRWIALGGVVLSFALSRRNTKALWNIYRKFGLLSTATIRSFVNTVIRDRLIKIKADSGLDFEIPDEVTFRDLAGNIPTIVPLKIVATNVDLQQLQVFDATLTPNVVIAEAVAASIAIPIVFRPAEIPSFGPGRFADGGLVSNFPIWVFTEEKLAFERENAAQPPVPIVGFSLADGATDPVKLREDFSGYLGKLLAAILHGSQATIANFVEDVRVVPLKVELDMLDFAQPLDAYVNAFKSGRDQANRHLRFMLDAKPDRLQFELRRIRTKAVRELNKNRTKRGRPKVSGLRVNLIVPFGQQSLRVAESVGMDGDADDRLVLDRRGRGVAAAFRARDITVFQLGVGNDDDAHEFMTKYERALVRKSVRTVIGVPIFTDLDVWALDSHLRPEPDGVLAIDSDQQVVTDFRDEGFQNSLVQEGAVLYRALNMEIENG